MLFSMHEARKTVPENTGRCDQIFRQSASRARLRCFDALAERREVSSLRFAARFFYGQSQSLDLQRQVSKETAILSQGWNDHGG